jgi:biopolymer transport protein ExbB
MKKGYFGVIVMAVMLVAMLVPIVSVVAQEAGAGSEAAAVAAESEVASISIGSLLKSGGWAMYPLGLFSVAMLYFIIRNSMLLREKGLLRVDLKEQMEGLLRERKVHEARELCQANQSLMTYVLDAGLERIDENDYDPAHVMEAIEEAGNEQMVSYMKPINYLSIIGGTAPMLGLLGTVSGMIKAFQTIATGKMGDPEALASNIGEALVTTAAGLIIAIPAMMTYFIFKNNFIKSMATMGRMVSHYMAIYRNAK